MEAVLDVVAGTGVVLLLLAAAAVDRRWARGLAVAAVAAAVYALHPIAVRQSLSAFVGGLDGAGLQTLAALLAFDGALGCGGVALLLGARHDRRLRWFERLAARHVGILPAPALFYVEVKAFHAASGWSFSTTALALCLAVVAAGMGGSEAIRRLLPDRDLRAELRLLVHVGQVVLAAGLTAFALQGGGRSAGAAVEAGPLAVVAGAAALGVLIGYWSHRRRQRRLAGRASSASTSRGADSRLSLWNC